MLSRAAVSTSLDAHVRDELTYARRGLASEDSREARRAILDKRKPSFQGR